MAYRSPLLRDDKKIVSCHQGLCVPLISFVLNGLRHNYNLGEGDKDFNDIKPLGPIRALTAELGIYEGV